MNSKLRTGVKLYWQKTYHGLNLRSGIGIQVKKTVTRRKDLRPQTSDKAPINGAQRKDKIPCKIKFFIIILERRH